MSEPLIRQHTPTVITVDGSVVVTMDAVISRIRSGRNSVTRRPVERGASFVDHVEPDPESLSIQGIVTAAPAFAQEGDTTPANRDILAEQLLFSLRDKAVVVGVSTATGSFPEMVITSLDATRDVPTGQAVAFTLTLERVTFAGAREVVIPPEIIAVDSGARSGGSSRVDGGTRQGQDADGTDADGEAAARQSTLRSIVRRGQ